MISAPGNFRIAPLFFALALAACAAAVVPTIETTTFAPALGVNLAASTKTADGAYYRDLAVGAGAAVTAGQTLSVHYTGWLADGTEFDSNAGAGAFSFRLGAGQVIGGWDEGLAGVKVGSTRQLILPPSLGYGASGYGPIPPNAMLVFNVQVDAAQ
jgi:FKBP-type peptidyl-prolyl cis-trans isomerase FkpA